MKDLIRSHTLLLSLSLCLSAILSFWALEKDNCLEIDVEKIKIKVACKSIHSQKYQVNPSNLIVL